MVVFGDPAQHGTTTGRCYKVLSTVDLPDGGWCYRIKSIAELSGRLASECTLEPRPAPFRLVAKALCQDLNPRLVSPMI